MFVDDKKGSKYSLVNRLIAFAFKVFFGIIFLHQEKSIFIVDVAQLNTDL